MSKNTSSVSPVTKILTLDIEASGLNADFGVIFCISYKWLHEDKVHTIKISDYKEYEKDKTNDKPVIRDFLKVLSEAEIIITYNGKRYDMPMILSKTLEYNLPVPSNVPHLDIYYFIKYNFKLSRKSLQNVGYYLDLSNEKTQVEGKIWRKAMTGDRKSLNWIYKHCEDDIRVLEELYLKIRPLIRRHPRVGSVGECSACGSRRLHRRGRALSTTTKAERWRYCCADCGSWSVRS